MVVMRILSLGMLASAAVAAACPACTTIPLSPGEPGVRASTQWIQGEPTEVVFTWNNATECEDDWSCVPPQPPLTILHLACQGCSVVGDPTGTSTPNWAVVKAVATVDGPITLSATLRFDATSDQRVVSATATGDHEVALEAACKVVDSAEVTSGPIGRSVPIALFQPCGATRLASQTAVVLPVIRTFQGTTRFPFCAGGGPCTNYFGEQLRPLASIAIAPAPTSWAFTIDTPAAMFAALPSVIVDPTVTVSAPLADGTIAKTSIVIPAIQ
jgi:hypothetical protein